MRETQDDGVAAVAALDEPTRRRLYEHVVRQAAPVSRDDAASAIDVPRSTAVFHLDRLADEGLLDVVYERRTGRSGPGAGRPSKLYCRSEREVAVSLPGRRYDLAGALLAAALEEAEASGDSPRAALQRRARALGRGMAAEAHAGGPGGDPRRLALAALESHGYEPRVESGDVVLANCPFHALAEEHTTLVCGMNLHLLDGLVEGLGGADRADGASDGADEVAGDGAGVGGLRPRLDPAPGRCCVVLGTDPG